MRRMRWWERLPVDPDVDPGVDTGQPAHARWAVVLVFVGGCVGGLVRYAVVKAWPEPHAGFPWSTFAVNVGGALLLGVIVVVATDVGASPRYLRPVLGAGFCGALTTFSSIVVSVDRLAAHGHASVAAGYLVATVAAGLCAVWLGATCTRAVAG